MKAPAVERPGSAEEVATRLREAAEVHPFENLGSFRELDAGVFDHLEVVAPGVPEVEPPAGQDLGPGFHERATCGLQVVHDQADVPRLIRRLAPARAQGDELVANVDEGHPGAASAELELEDAAEERKGFIDVSHLDGDVVDADQPDGH